MKLVILLACLMGCAVAADLMTPHCKERKEDIGKCDCCPPPCCCKCEDDGKCTANLDLTFIVDASGSIGSTEWGQLKNFLTTVISQFEGVGSEQRVAVVKFSSDVVLEWNLDGDETKNLQNLKDAINSLTKLGQSTNIAGALEVAATQVFSGSPGDSPSRNNVAVVFTDGRQNENKNMLEPYAKKLKQEAFVLAVGITDKADKAQLQTIATGDDDSNIFDVTSFNALKQILQELSKKICAPSSCYCCCPPPWKLQKQWW